MVTVIRPSRARCVNGTIPRRERAVFTFKEGGVGHCGSVGALFLLTAALMR